VRQDHRTPFLAALQRARETAYPPGEFVGQESFMRAGEIRQLARHAGIGPGVSVLDLCCGVAGPGRLMVAELDCHYLGVDYSVDALEIAGDLSADLRCRFTRMHLPPLPDERFEVVLLLETMLAFPDKRTLVEAVSGVLEPGGRFAFTLEEGVPLSASEQDRMPDADTVWLIELADWTRLLHEVGFEVTWQQEYTSSHHATATALLEAIRADSAAVLRQVGARALAELLTAHELWTDWLGGGRVRKFAQVVERM
jgi:ubiquinone/menaquinone biosynthesis C-methylase UbiE